MSGRDDRNLRAALAYAKAGWRVFPCTPGEKVPATSNGVKDATSDECADPGLVGEEPGPERGDRLRLCRARTSWTSTASRTAPQASRRCACCARPA